MGRWKLGPQGGYYDPNDSGPDQYNPTPAERASQGGGDQGGYAPPTGGVSGYGGGMNPHPGQPMPFPTMPMPPGGFPRRGDPGWSGFTDPKPSPGSQIPFMPIPGGGWQDSGGGQSPWSLGTLNGSIGQQGNVFGAGASMGAPKSSRGGLFGGLGSLNRSVGTTIGADPSRRWY